MKSIIERLEIKETGFMIQLIEILDQAAKIELSAGKDPMGLAAALYLSCVINGENKTQKDIAVSAGVTGVTIRNRYNDLKEALTL